MLPKFLEVPIFTKEDLDIHLYLDLDLDLDLKSSQYIHALNFVIKKRGYL